MHTQVRHPWTVWRRTEAARKTSTPLLTSNSLFFEPTLVIRAMAGPAALHHLCLITLTDPQ
ncbi:hypothetical protein OHT57_46170 [Streptomyces sp. NBC_00285]|uniref:hypothetical protein n=1 Tax=Streptomyces sp. NBC_00285 TaxID=2975700 RepID=UPI002E2D5CD7|nr:hypothetical protein [Streptomyces sp. NBC_00285]